MPPSRVLVTGASGYTGSHVIKQLLEANYNVRGIVRNGKASRLLEMFPAYDSQRFDVVEISDIVDCDLSSALKDVGSVIHTAAVSAVVVGGNVSSAEIIKTAVDGTLNVVNQAIAAGIRKIVFTSSIVTLLDPDLARGYSSEPFTENSWSNITEKDLDPNDHIHVAYVKAKTVAELKIWELAEKHPEIDFTALLGTNVYGELLSGFPVPVNIASIGSTAFPYMLIGLGPDKPGIWPPIPFGTAVHVRDFALAHVLALKSLPLPDGRKKRLIVSAGAYKWLEVAELIRKERPELAHRLPKEGDPISQFTSPLDTSLTKEAIGLENYISWQQAFLDSIDSCLTWEKSGSF